MNFTESTGIKQPFYTRFAFIAIALFAFGYTLYIAQGIILPLVYAFIIAILLNPLVNFLMRKRFSKPLAITVAVVLAMIVLIGVLVLIVYQFSVFSETFPQLKEKFTLTKTGFVQWISETFGFKTAEINARMDASRLKVINDFAVGQRLTEIGHIVVVLLLLPVYIFLILHYKTLLLEFIRKLFRTEHHIAVVDVLAKSKSLVQTYLTGLLFEMAIVAVLNSVGLLILGIDYAIILGLIGAVLNIIPYIGGMIAIALPMTIAYITKDSALYPLLVLLLYTFIQLIDNNYIIPKIVASRVKLNALISIVVILIGGAIWGIPGMFLAIPLTAIAKVICDNIEPLKPWGFLLGNIVPVTSRFTFLKPKKATTADLPPKV